MPIPARSASLTSLALALTTTACMGSLSLGGRSGTAGSGPSSGAGGSPIASGPGSSSAAGGAVTPGVPTTKFSDFAFEVKDSTGDYHRAWIIDKLTTFEVAPACYEKMVDRNNSALHSASFYTRDIAELAKTLTGDDWSDIESQNNNDRENNKRLVEPMIVQFANHFGMTISIDGDDCDVRHGALWMKYWTTIGEAVRENPPASGKTFIKLAVRGDARDVSVTFDEASDTYTITAPRDIEKVGWTEKLEKPFRKRARQK